MNDEIKNSSTWLDEQRQQDDGFKLPDGYFDNLEDRVMDRIEAAGLQRKAQVSKSKKHTKHITLVQIFMAVAAVFALVLAAVWFVKPSTAFDQQIASIELGDAEIESYLLENVQYFDENQLAMLPELADNEIQTPPSSLPSPSKKTIDKYDISPEDLNHILNDMTEEELEEIL